MREMYLAKIGVLKFQLSCATIAHSAFLSEHFDW